MSREGEIAALGNQIKEEILRLDSSIEFRPGLDSEILRESFKQIRFNPPDEIIDLYSWHDGSYDIEILPGACYFPFATSLENHKRTNSIYGFLGKKKNFRFLSDFSDGGYGIAQPKHGSHVIQRCIHAPWEVGFDSLQRLLDFSLTCYKSDVFFFSDGSIEPDWDRYGELEDDRDPQKGG
ncbi:MAG: hypothetical protein P1U86_00965 [Verrucomicrobiales bacterium]|nr:hypothetical protein [Verrucomicrobiales bacterium]